MPKKITDLTSQEVAVIDYLYMFCGPLDFSEYLLERNEQMLSEVVSGNLELLNEGDFLSKQVQKTLVMYLPDPDAALEPNIQDKAFSGLKALVVFAAEEYLKVERVRCEVEGFLKSTASTGTAEERADRVLQLLLHNMTCRHDEDPEENIYASEASWLHETDVGTIELTKSLVWSTIRKLMYDGVVGITERLDDVKLRARYTILWQLRDFLLANSDE